MWQAIKNWIKNKLTPAKPLKPAPEVIKPLEPIPNQEEVDNFPIDKNLKIALIRGHGSDDSGAVGNGTSEVEYNTWIMDYVSKKTRRNVKLFYGKKSLDTVYKAVLWAPDVSIQLHLNSFNGSANGCEVLVLSGDTRSYPLAEKFAKEFTQEFGRTLRRPEAKGKKILSSADRGAASLRAAPKGVKILVEPFFIDNKNDFVPKEEYAKFLTKFVDNI